MPSNQKPGPGKPPAAGPADDLHETLISARSLRESLGDPGLLLLDASPTPIYREGHIPGAHSVSFTGEESVSQGVNLSYGGGVDYFTDQVNARIPFQEHEPEAMERLFQRWGIDAGRTVVVYDQGGSFLATRLFYSLYYHGFPVENFRILDGGLSKWKAEGFEVSTEIPAPPEPGAFEIGGLRAGIKADVGEVLAASADRQGSILIESLGPDWHFGAALYYSRRGHIPFARMVPPAEFFNADNTFKSPRQIRDLVEFAGLRPDQVIYTHCGGGIAASLAFFALKILAGYAQVKHFPESIVGWLRDERELPLWTYDAPYLLRDADWLHWWGGERTRTLGSIHVSILDIRSERDYGRGHVPFALNLPASAFGTASDGELARLLSRSGVNPEHEAVILSGNGLDKDAALAFVRLESLGQKAVSIFAGTIEEWVARGYELRDRPTLVAEKTSPHDLAIPQVPYAPEPRDAVIVDSVLGPQGKFPRIVLASGRALPASLDAGGATVVHVPCTDLLDDGLPRSAAEIWDILSEAGLPRFAEIVTVSDDAGEAAISYVILKLMGYPRVSTALANAGGPGVRTTGM